MNITTENQIYKKNIKFHEQKKLNKYEVYATRSFVCKQSILLSFVCKQTLHAMLRNRSQVWFRFSLLLDRFHLTFLYLIFCDISCYKSFKLYHTNDTRRKHIFAFIFSIAVTQTKTFHLTVNMLQQCLKSFRTFICLFLFVRLILLWAWCIYSSICIACTTILSIK